MRRGIPALSALIAVLAALAVPSTASAQAMVIRIGPEGGCEVGPTDIPDVPVSIPSTCLVVAAPSGHSTVRVRGTIPAGFELSSTYTAQMSCFFPGLGLGSGRIVATVSGQVSATCQIP
jgi:hypothetical protein